MRVIVNYPNGTQRVQLDDGKEVYLSASYPNGQRRIDDLNGNIIGWLSSEYDNGSRYASFNNGSEFEVYQRNFILSGKQEIWEKIKDGNIDNLTPKEKTIADQIINESDSEIQYDRRKYEEQKYLNDQQRYYDEMSLLEEERRRQEEEDEMWDDDQEEETDFFEIDEDDEEYENQQRELVTDKPKWKFLELVPAQEGKKIDVFPMMEGYVALILNPAYRLTEGYPARRKRLEEAGVDVAKMIGEQTTTN